MTIHKLFLDTGLNKTEDIRPASQILERTRLITKMAMQKIVSKEEFQKNFGDYRIALKGCLFCRGASEGFGEIIEYTALVAKIINEKPASPEKGISIRGEAVSIEIVIAELSVLICNLQEAELSVKKHKEQCPIRSPESVRLAQLSERRGIELSIKIEEMHCLKASLDVLRIDLYLKGKRKAISTLLEQHTPLPPVLSNEVIRYCF